MKKLILRTLFSPLEKRNWTKSTALGTLRVLKWTNSNRGINGRLFYLYVWCYYKLS